MTSPRKKRSTEADRLLVAAVKRDYGIAVTPRRLQDYRRAGLVDHEITRLGGRAGTETRYPEHAAGQLAQAARLMGQYGRMDLVVAALFGAGRNPTEAATRRALRWLVRTDLAAGERFLDAADEERVADTVRKGASHARREVPEAVEGLNLAAGRLAEEELHRERDEIGLSPQDAPLHTAKRHARENMVVCIAALISGAIDHSSDRGRPEVVKES